MAQTNPARRAKKASPKSAGSKPAADVQSINSSHRDNEATSSDVAGVVVTGRPEKDVSRALELLDAVRRIQRDQEDDLTQNLLHAMTDVGEPTLPPERATLAQRRAALRARLLAGGYYTTAQIAELRGSEERSARTFVARKRERNSLFTVKHGKHVVVPAILLDSDGQVSPVGRAVEVLRPLGLDEWELWAWLASPSSWLSGDTPAAVLVENPTRGMAAVHAYASQLAPAWTA